MDSDRFSGVSRLVVRYGWRPFQRRFKIPSTTPSRDFDLRAATTRRDVPMGAQAAGEARPDRRARTAGLQRPKVKKERTPDEVDAELKRLREAPDTRRRTASPRCRPSTSSSARSSSGTPPKMPLPCYFNTGCCSYGTAT